MARIYETPGVYYERADQGVPPIGPLRTDIAGFVGIASRGPVDVPVPVESWRQFDSHFGGFTGVGYLAYAVRGFFENGGTRCWVVRVASKDTAGGCQASGVSIASAARPVWRISASSPGTWGNGLRVRLIETHNVQTVSLPAGSKPEYARVANLAGFVRGTQVRLTQAGNPVAIHKVISYVDPVEARIGWVHPRPELRMPYDAPLTGFDPNLPILIDSVEYTVSASQGATVLLVQPGLSLIREHASYGPRVLRVLPVPSLNDTRLPSAPPPVIIEDLRPEDALVDRLALSDEWLRLNGGADGLALLTTDDFVGSPSAATDLDVAKAQKQRGLEALAQVPEVAIVAIPDIHIHPIAPPLKAPPVCIPDPCSGILPLAPEAPADFELPPVFSDAQIYQVQAALVNSCELLGDRFAILETPQSTALDSRMGIPAVLEWRSRFDSTYAGLYYPWLQVVDPLRQSAGLTRAIPPSGHAAGQYARGDLAVGVHLAPANSPLGWVQDITAKPDDEIHGLLNTRGVNLIKVAANRYIRLFGARTVSSDTDWRFINVRRLMMKLRKAIYLAMQWAVFEPNDTLTRTKIQLSLHHYFEQQWQLGALQGATTAEAFFVQCDEANNPPRLRDNGQLLAEVGVAPTVPLEFIVFRVGRVGHAFEIEESTLTQERRH